MLAIACSFPTANAQEDQTHLSMEFLEYLAEMEQVNGDWVDAADMADESSVILLDSTENAEQQEKTAQKASDKPNKEEK